MCHTPIPPTIDDWHSAVGRFLLNFGALEYLVMVFLKDRLPPDDYMRARKIHLKDRLELIARFLGHHDCPAANRGEFARLCDRLAPSRELRNQLAHGHLIFRQEPPSGPLKLSIMKVVDLDAAHQPDTIHVEYSDLANALPILTELIEQFSGLAGFKP